MPSSESERVTCPACGKGYRWQASLIGKSVPCKQCATSFEVPSQPGMGVRHKPEAGDIYELAADPDAEPDLPRAFQVAKPPPAEQPAPADEPVVESVVQPVIDTARSAGETTEAPLDDGGEAPAEPEVHLSESAKAARREAQRIAAAENAPQPKWWQQKWLIISAILLVLFVIIYWAMHLFSDAMEGGLHNTLRLHHVELFAASDPTQPRTSS